MGRNVTQTLSDLNIATQDYIENVVSGINNHNYVHAKLWSKSKDWDGGNEIEVPISYGRENVESKAEYDSYNLQPRDILEYAKYAPKHVVGDMSLPQMTVEAKQKGTKKIIDLAETRAKNMKESMDNQFSEYLFNPVASIASTDFDSLVKICATKNNTVGGINAATESRFDWNPHVLDYGGTSITWALLIDPTPSNDYYIETLLRKLVGPLTIGDEAPTIGLCSQVVWDAYEYVLKAGKNFDSRYEVDGGFETLKFRKMKLAVESHIPGGKMNRVDSNYGMMLALNENHLSYYHAGGQEKFHWQEWKKAEQGTYYFSLLDWMGAFTCSRRDRQGAVIGLPTDYQIYGV